MRLVVDFSDLVARLKGLTQTIGFSGELGEQVAEIMRDDAKRQFQAGGIPPWPRLRDSTVKAKARLGYPRLNRRGLVPASLVQRGAFGPQNILIRTGALLSSWTQEQDPHHVQRVGDGEVEIGSALHYAEHHQKGGRKLPQRPIRVTEEAKKKAADAVSKAISEAT